MVTFVRSRQACLIQRGMSALGQKQTFAPQKVMSALPPIADMCSATRDVRFGPIADIGTNLHVGYSITSSARASSIGKMVRPRAFAVLRLMTSSNFVGCVMGRSAGLAPLRTRPV